MPFTRQLIASAAAATAMCSVPPVFASSKSVKIAVGGKALYYYLPISIAESLGYFKDEGLDVEIIDFQGGSRSLQAVVGGSASTPCRCKPEAKQCRHLSCRAERRSASLQ
mgnify:CR=1 FL=1